MSCQVSTCNSEQTLLKMTRKSKVGHLPEPYLIGDTWKPSDNIRDFSGDQRNFENRILHSPVYKQYKPLNALFTTSSKYLGRMVNEMLNCECAYLPCVSLTDPHIIGMHDLWYSEARILHRDISINNIVWEFRHDEPHFILSDLDLATVVTVDGKPDSEPSSNHRTGTLPFLSLDVLDDLAKFTLAQANNQPLPPPVMHLLRFDYESLLWAALWCASNMEEDVSKEHKDAAAAIIREWENQSFQAVADSKTALLFGAKKKMEFPYSPKFKPWEKWFNKWMKLLKEGRNSYEDYALELYEADTSPKPTFDWETLDGRFTKDAILKVLDPADMTNMLS